MNSGQGVVLAMDTSGPTARVALVSEGGELLVAGERSGPRHSATLLPLCHDLLSARGLGVSQLAALACGRGPGSFTGLRVGLAVCKGFALAHDLPVFLVSSLQALALDLAAQEPTALLVPCIDAGKGEVHGQLQRLDPAAPLDPAALSEELRLRPGPFIDRVRAQAGAAPLIVGGTGVDRHADLFRQQLPSSALRVDLAAPSAVAIARLALRARDRGERHDLDTAIPSYGRAPDITTPKR
jgi:tRNA threonylcarbamoyladenosine biosynthesis protein TsaB